MSPHRRTEVQGEGGVGRPGERVAGGVRAEAPAHEEDDPAVLRGRRDGDGDGVEQAAGAELPEGGRLHAAGAVHDELQGARRRAGSARAVSFREES